MSKITFEVVASEAVGIINPNLHGHFMEHLGGCIDGGVWVGMDSAIPNNQGIRTDVVEALKRLSPPVLRWPGGCFADDYHWRNGIGSAESRPRTVNMHWGNEIELNGFGTHEFMHLCQLLNTTTYLAGNLGSGSPKEMRDWVEYCNFPGGSTLSDERIANGATVPFAVEFWGVGNENWGCGGNFSPEDYGTEYRRFSTYLRNWGGTKLSLIACGPNGNDTEWTRRFMNKIKKDWWDGAPLHGYAAHMYCHSESTATEFEENDWNVLLAFAMRLEGLIQSQRELLDEYDPERKIGLIIDEWGAWHKPTPGTNPAFLWQQSTVRDALVASLTLDLFNRQADKVVMGNIAQTINVLQSLILTEEEKMVLTPTYHIFDLYQPHKRGQSVRVSVDSAEVVSGLPQVSGSASVRDGVMTVTVSNASMASPVLVEFLVPGVKSVREVRGLAYDGDVHSHNTFESPDSVSLRDFPLVVPDGDRFVMELGAGSVTRLTLEIS